MIIPMQPMARTGAAISRMVRAVLAAEQSPAACWSKACAGWPMLLLHSAAARPTTSARPSAGRTKLPGSPRNRPAYFSGIAQLRAARQ